MTFEKLNLPNAPLELTQRAGKLYVKCLIRNKYLVCTPEEWVRQHVIHHLITDHLVKKGRIAVEFALEYNGRSKRADIVVVNEEGRPILLVECKAPEIKLSKEVLYQASTYNFELNVDHLLLTNGLQHIYCTIDRENNELQFPDQFNLFKSKSS